MRILVITCFKAKLLNITQSTLKGGLTRTTGPASMTLN